MKDTVLLLFMLVMSASHVFGQEDPPQGLAAYQIHMQMAREPIVLDGLLDDQAWLDAAFASDFWQQYPVDHMKATPRTEVRLTYDADHLYIAAVCYDVQGYVVQTLKRDNGFFEGDAFGVIIDPMNSKGNGFLFGVSPYNVQTDELLGLEAKDREDLSFSWDNRWFSVVSRFPDHYIIEMAIPFKTLRFKSSITTWGINFIRNDLSRNQHHSWTPIPVNFELYDLGYTGNLIWDRSPAKTGTNISVLPYATASIMKDRESDMPQSKPAVAMGADVKVALTSSLNLDLTVNPDFSQVDVDVQQTNLTRFNLRFPEKRGFFQENEDLFAEFGPNNAKPIFTRRIGLDDDNMPVPISYGARLSGNLNTRLRVGLLNLQTKARNATLRQNYSIAVFNHGLWSRSVVRGYVTNRQSYKTSGGSDQPDYGRNAGLEFNYLNESGTWNYFADFHLSGKPDIGIGTFSNLGLEHAGRNWRFRLNYLNIESDYYADIGFIPRLNHYDALAKTTVHIGYQRLFGRVGYIIRPTAGQQIITHEIEARNETNLYPDGTFSDRESRVDYEIKFRNTSNLTLQLQDNETRLLFATGFTDEEPLNPGIYRYPRFTLTHETDARKLFSVQSEIALGQFYNGHLNKYLLQLSYRRQPWANFSLSWEQNNLTLPDPHGQSKFTLINMRGEVNFSTRVFWTTFLQYNTQQENFNVNSRLQWRYATMSDLFLVYADNYTISPFMEKNRSRAIMLKINYMFNL